MEDSDQQVRDRLNDKKVKMNRGICFFVIYILLINVELFAQKRDTNILTIRSSYTTDSLRVSDLYLQGIKELSVNGNKSNAFSIFKEIININPTHSPSLYHIALMSDNLKYSYDMIEKAIANDPNNTDYKYLRANILRRSGDIRLTVEAYKDLLKINNGLVNLHLTLAEVYDEANMPYAAINALDSAYTLFGKRPEILAYQQNIYQRLNMGEKAVKTGIELLNENPDNIQSLVSLAESYSTNKNDSLAIVYYEKAKAIDSTSLVLQISLNEYLRNNGSTEQYLTTLSQLFSNKDLNKDKKIEYFNAVIRKPEIYREHILLVENLVNSLRATYPGDWDIDKLYATHLINIGKVRKSSVIYKTHLNDSINKKEAYRQVISVESYLKESPDSILKYCTAALPIFKDDIDMKLLISNVFSQNNNLKGAIKLATECYEMAKDDSTRSAILGYTGDMYQMHNSLKQTYKYYDKALKYDPKNIVVLNNYSYFLSESGKDLEKALTMSSLVLSKEPDNATYIDTYGWILYKLGRYEEAKTTIRRAIALDQSESPELFIHMGDIFLALGDTLSAEMYWKRAITKGANKEQIEAKIAEVKK